MAELDGDRLRGGRGAHDLDGFADDGDQVDGAQLEAQLAGDDARNIEDVFDDLALRGRVAVNDIDAFADRGGASPSGL